MNSSQKNENPNRILVFLYMGMLEVAAGLTRSSLKAETEYLKFIEWLATSELRILFEENRVGAHGIEPWTSLLSVPRPPLAGSALTSASCQRQMSLWLKRLVSLWLRLS